MLLLVAVSPVMKSIVGTDDFIHNSKMSVVICRFYTFVKFICLLPYVACVRHKET